jgi:hypothetical protein
MKELLAKVDPYLRKIGLYSSYTLSQEEFVGSVNIFTSNVFNESTNPPFVMEHDFYRRLESFGYEKPPTFLGVPLIAAKKHPITNRIHDVSLRKVDPENTRKQYHLHYWLEPLDDGHEAQIAVHREYRPDITILEGETPAQAKNRLQTHYRPAYGTDYEKGKLDSNLKALLDD